MHVVEYKRKSKGEEDPNLCSVKGCNEPSKRSLSARAVTKALSDLKFKTKDPRKVRLCKEHYKDYKKATREERKLERMSWDR